MAEAFFRKRLGVLIPADDDAIELLRGLKTGDDYRVTITRPRNYRHHCLFFALLGKVFENQEIYESREALLYALKIAVGHVEWVTLPNSNPYPMPKSISFASMDQTAFDGFYDKCVEKIVEHFLPGVDEKALRDEVLEMVA